MRIREETRCFDVSLFIVIVDSELYFACTECIIEVGVEVETIGTKKNGVFVWRSVILVTPGSRNSGIVSLYIFHITMRDNIIGNLPTNYR